MSHGTPIWSSRDTIGPPVHVYTAAQAWAMIPCLRRYIRTWVRATSQLPRRLKCAPGTTSWTLPHIIPPIFGERCLTRLAILALLLHSAHVTWILSLVSAPYDSHSGTH